MIRIRRHAQKDSPEHFIAASALLPAGKHAGAGLPVLTVTTIRLAVMMQDYLGQHGYRLVLAETAADGLARLRASGEPVDLVILDIMLPMRTGWSCAGRSAVSPTFPSSC